MGYPVNLFNTNQNQIDFNQALIRKGVVSQKNKLTRRLIIDSAVFGGNSGGPIFIKENPSSGTTTFKLIGIVAEYVPSDAEVQLSATNSVTVKVNSGYSVAEPIDFSIDLIRQLQIQANHLLN